MDGLYYAAVANNMANGFGSFWVPHLSPNLHSDFFEHPPLAMGLQAALFKVFGSSIYVERFYSLLTFIATAGLISLIWKELTGSFKRLWLPIFMWIIAGQVFWAVSNNMLENTMMIFTTLAVWLYFVKVRSGNRLWLLFAGISLVLALFTKGFFCLYVWGLPFFDWLFRRQSRIHVALTDTLILVLASVVPTLLLYYFVEPVRLNVDGYFQEQLIVR
ncbi:MAG: glycosyltransferase family 39 protein [Bacteroidota bacterium]